MTSENLKHLIITRFCIRFMDRASSVAGKSRSMVIDPLEESNVQFRHFILRTVTYESILNQTSTNFDWIILVEPDLKADVLDDLKNMTGSYPNMHVHELSETDDLGRHDWLEEYIPMGTEYLLTTHLDDDDGLGEILKFVVDRSLIDNISPITTSPRLL